MRKEYWYWIIGVMIIFLSSSYIIYKLVDVSAKPRHGSIHRPSFHGQQPSITEVIPKDTEPTFEGDPIRVVRELEPPAEKEELDVDKIIADIITGKT